jgi:putative serine protease PepD
VSAHTAAPGQPPRPGQDARRDRARLLGPAAAVAAVIALVLAVVALVVAAGSDNSNSTPAAQSGAAGGSTTACPVTTIADEELPSVVTISVSGPTSSGTGSGEIIDDSGHVLTNNHVIAAAASGGSMDVVFNDGASATARLVGRDPQTDLAVLQVPQAQDRRAIRFGSSRGVRVGQPVVALGAPLGLSGTVTSGIISARDRSVNVPADNGGTALLVAALQTDAAINPGNSGGALVDCAGELVGVPTAGATVPNENGGSSVGNIGLGFAIPADFAHSIAEELIANGRVTHGFLGMSVDTTGAGSGLFVTAVSPTGPAAHAGLRVGDVITKINDAAATSAEQLLAITLTNKPGDTVTLTYQRQGATHQTRLTLGSD